MKSTIKAYGASLLVSSLAFSDYLSVVEDGYWSVQQDFDGSDVSVYVVDLYMTADNSDDVLLNVFNFVGNDDAPNSFFQSFTGGGWVPNNLGGPFDTGALRKIDSFVTIGGFDLSSSEPPQQIPGAGSGTGLDPNFGGEGAPAPGIDAGWYNGNPTSLNGKTQISGRLGGIPATFIGRFSFPEEFSLDGSSFECTWNQGLGTPAIQASFFVTENPGCPDTDDDGVDDCVDGCPEDPNKTEPGDCGCGAEDLDSDKDGVADCNDGCPTDPNKTSPGDCGCNASDADGDGVDDCVDNCPDDPNKTDPGDCGCGNEDTDTDGDGTADCVDNCPDDPDKTEPGFCGCGTVDTNVNGDVDCDGDYDIDDAIANSNAGDNEIAASGTDNLLEKDLSNRTSFIPAQTTTLPDANSVPEATETPVKRPTSLISKISVLWSAKSEVIEQGPNEEQETRKEPAIGKQQPSASILDLSQPHILKTGIAETNKTALDVSDEELDIPAFLRRQAN